jgi:hypothetical protein
VLLCAALGALGPFPQAHAAGDAISVEQRVKAASLYKFVAYVDWPPQAFAAPAEPYVVGITGAEEIAQELTTIAAGRTINNRPLIVRRIKAGDPLPGLHVLFIGRDESARQAQWLQLAQKHPLLTVTETDGALAQGSMINFRLAEDRVRFEVSLDAVEKSELKISSRMLSVALNVLKGVRP